MPDMIGGTPPKLQLKSAQPVILNNNIHHRNQEAMWELGFSGNSVIFSDIKLKADLGSGITLESFF